MYHCGSVQEPHQESTCSLTQVQQRPGTHLALSPDTAAQDPKVSGTPRPCPVSKVLRTDGHEQG